MVTRDEWRGLIRRTVEPDEPIKLVMPLQASPRGGSGTFLARAADGREWWVKPLNNAQGERVTVTETLVAAVGSCLGLAVCESGVAHIPSDLEGWEFRPGHYLVAGLAHASLSVPQAMESRRLQYRTDDDNRRRHAGLFALYDLCWGGDDQWLYCQSDDNATYSHDHGWYLPPVGSQWNTAALQAHANDPHFPAWDTNRLDDDEVARVVTALRGFDRAAVAAALSTPPSTWPVSDDELEYVGWFLETRAQHVADRLEAAVGGGQP